MMDHPREVVKRRRRRLEAIAASGEPGAEIAQQLLAAADREG